MQLIAGSFTRPELYNALGTVTACSQHIA